MLGRIALWRHLVVAVVIAACAILALTGKIGDGNHHERFDAKQLVVQPSGTDGVQVRETVDEDFGNADRHGYERIIPNDFGVPVNIQASSPNANADVSVGQVSAGTRIRLGDPNKTVSGRKRYLLTYTLPDAQISTGTLALDLIGTRETLQTSRFDIVVTGMVLSDPLCNVGSAGRSGGCTLADDGGVYRATISPLEHGNGITIGGTITGLSNVEDIAAPQLPAARTNHRLLLGVLLVPIGLLTALAILLVNRRNGRNEVFAGGAATAAYGTGPITPTFARAGAAVDAGRIGALPDVLPPEVPIPPPNAPTTLVADDRMAALATIEFVPPRGVEPWQGAVLLNERVDDDTVASWFSGLAGREAITLQDDDGHLVISSGPKRASVNGADAALLDRVFHGTDSVTLGTYDKHFAAAWRAIRVEQSQMISNSGWWRRPPPAGANASTGVLMRFGIGLLLLAFWIGSGVVALVGGLTSPILAVALGVVAPGIAGFFVYHFLLPARSATGSALALRTESFRRFLAASEGRHVDWAWKHGLLREYSGWAVALGAAAAWSNALRLSGVPPTDSAYVYSPLLFYSMHSSIASTYHAPPSTGSGGSSGFSGGGFSGGSVGGGGGGGSSGSW